MIKKVKVLMTNFCYRDRNEADGGICTSFFKSNNGLQEIELDKFLHKVGDEGYNYSGALFEEGKRDIESWKEQQVFSLDFDNKPGENSITPEELLERCEKYNLKPFGIYSSLGSKYDGHKFRVLFLHNTIIKHAKVARYMIHLFYNIFPELDTQCLEIARFYFGGKKVLYEDYDAEFDVITLASKVTEYTKEKGCYDDYKEYINDKCANPEISVIGVDDYFEEYDANTETKEERIEREKRNDEKMLRIFNFNDVSYVIDFYEVPKITKKKSKGTKKKSNDDEFEFLSKQKKKKLKDALKHIDITKIKDVGEYDAWKNVLWGIKNTYDEDGWDIALEWSKKIPGFKNDGDVRKKWDDRTQRGEITIGTIYKYAEDQGWEYKDEIIEAWNKKYFVSKLGSKTLVFEPTIDHNTKFQVLRYQDKRNFRDLHINKKTTVDDGNKDKVMPAVDYWMNHENVRTYPGGVHFDPSNRLPSNCYNMWMGFRYEDPNYKLPDKQNSKIRMYMDHIYRNICGSNQKIFEYIISWMAYAIQYPWKKSPVAIVLRSDMEGVGKGVFVNSFGKLFGDSYLPIANPETIVGSHNAQLQNCILLHTDEAKFEHKYAGMLRNLITEPFVNINPKGITGFLSKSYLHIIMSSNSDFVVPAQISSRRFCILEVEPNNMQDTKFFGQVLDDMNNGGHKELFHMLKRLDISNFDITQYPKTEALSKQIRHSLSPEDKYILEKLHDGIFDPERGSWDYITNDVLSEDYRNWIFNMYGHNKYKLSPQQWGYKLKEIFGESSVYRKKRVNKNIRNKHESKNIWVQKYILPPLDEARDLMEKYLGFEEQWEEIEVEDNMELMVEDKPKKKIFDMNQYKL